jgi:hypothetical protein
LSGNHGPTVLPGRILIKKDRNFAFSAQKPNGIPVVLAPTDTSRSARLTKGTKAGGARL